MCLAITPSNSAVERAFSRLTQILTTRRLSLSPDTAEQLLVVALDSAPWSEYDYAPILSMLRDNATRTHWRRPRSDLGVPHAKRSKTEASSSTSSGVHVRAFNAIGTHMYLWTWSQIPLNPNDFPPFRVHCMRCSAAGNYAQCGVSGCMQAVLCCSLHIAIHVSTSHQVLKGIQSGSHERQLGTETYFDRRRRHLKPPLPPGGGGSQLAQIF